MPGNELTRDASTPATQAALSTFKYTANARAFDSNIGQVSYTFMLTFPSNI